MHPVRRPLCCITRETHRRIDILTVAQLLFAIGSCATRHPEVPTATLTSAPPDIATIDLNEQVRICTLPPESLVYEIPGSDASMPIPKPRYTSQRVLVFLSIDDSPEAIGAYPVFEGNPTNLGQEEFNYRSQPLVQLGGNADTGQRVYGREYRFDSLEGAITYLPTTGTDALDAYIGRPGDLRLREVVVVGRAGNKIIPSIDGPVMECTCTGGTELETWADPSPLLRCLDVDLTDQPAIPLPVVKAVEVATGWGNTCVVTESGGVRCWGQNTEGFLGTRRVLVLGKSLQGTEESDAGFEVTKPPSPNYDAKSVGPVEVEGLPEPISSLAIGGYGVYALGRSGELYCWGRRCAGEPMGADERELWPKPRSVPSLGGGTRSVASGGASPGGPVCVIAKRGGVRCWGKLGFTMSERHVDFTDTPIDMPGLQSDVVKIDVNDRNYCALKSSGEVLCWGPGSIATGEQRSEPDGTPVVKKGLFPRAIDVAVGGSFSCALGETGMVKCWGSAGYGELGDGGETGKMRSSVEPVQVVDLPTTTAIAAESSHACALTKESEVFCWGKNNPTCVVGLEIQKIASSRPVPISGIPRNVRAIDVSSQHACALTESGEVYCWGFHHSGYQIGAARGTTSTKTQKIYGFGG
ncbi:MAG: hypothetical protein JW751_31255 [Polyangiaceae bacterium]|nr:hypothetical protein [Polyangiaceae bacterium]